MFNTEIEAHEVLLEALEVGDRDKAHEAYDYINSLLNPLVLHKGYLGRKGTDEWKPPRRLTND